MSAAWARNRRDFCRTCPAWIRGGCRAGLVPRMLRRRASRQANRYSCEGRP